ncbi:MAG: zf-HC2 domain-containing protein [Planctomycetota bacterium]
MSIRARVSTRADKELSLGRRRRLRAHVAGSRSRRGPGYLTERN